MKSELTLNDDDDLVTSTFDPNSSALSVVFRTIYAHLVWN